MTENKYMEINFDTLRNNMNEIILNEIPVWRKNKSGQMIIVPLKMLEQYIGSSGTEELVFYIESKWEERIKYEKNPSIPIKKVDNDLHSAITKNLHDDFYLIKRKSFVNMTSDERENHYDNIIKILENIDASSAELNADDVTMVISNISDAYALSKTSFDEIENNSEKRDTNHIQKVAKYTTELVENILRIIHNKKNANCFFNELLKKSTGSTVDHMNNVFLIFSSFLYYYNSQFKIGRIAKIRAEFKSNYEKIYRQNFSDFNFDALENIFKGGMSEIPEERLLDLSLGAFLHDIGKIDNINYFEGDAAYDKKTIMKHAPMSYNIIVKTREFTNDVALLSALHHEYYGNKEGYGLSKILFPEKNKSIKNPTYCMSFDIKDVKSGIALAYAPAKMLEIVDVFSALVDKKRKYREKSFSKEQALEIMKNDFIEKNLKLDPVFFTIFRDFIQSHSLLAS